MRLGTTVNGRMSGVSWDAGAHAGIQTMDTLRFEGLYARLYSPVSFPMHRIEDALRATLGDLPEPLEDE